MARVRLNILADLQRCNTVKFRRKIFQLQISYCLQAIRLFLGPYYTYWIHLWQILWTEKLFSADLIDYDTICDKFLRTKILFVADLMD